MAMPNFVRVRAISTLPRRFLSTNSIMNRTIMDQINSGHISQHQISTNTSRQIINSNHFSAFNTRNLQRSQTSSTMTITNQRRMNQSHPKRNRHIFNKLITVTITRNSLVTHSTNRRSRTIKNQQSINRMVDTVHTGRLNHMAFALTGQTTIVRR